MALSASDHVVVSDKDKEENPARTTQPLYSLNHNNEVQLPRPQLPTVEDALQYSPLSSIVPFSPGMCSNCVRILPFRVSINKS